MPGVPAEGRMQLEVAKGERSGPGKREFVCVWFWGGVLAKSHWSVLVE